MASSTSPGRSSPGDASAESDEVSRSRTAAAASITRDRSSFHTRATAWSTRRNEGRPWASSGGKYVPPWKTSPSGVRKAVSGHPPWPTRDCTARW